MAGALWEERNFPTRTSLDGGPQNRRVMTNVRITKRGR